MRIVLVIVAVLALGAVGAYAALGRGDELGDLRSPRSRPSPAGRTTSTSRAIAEGFNRPTWVGAAPGDDALWVLEQPGRVLRLEGGRRTVALDLSDQRRARRRAGPARHRLPPRLRHATGGSTCTGRTRRATRAWPSSAPAATGRSSPSRCAGCCTSTSPRRTTTAASSPFGPDGRLYLGLGDGGGAFDPRSTAQDPQRAARQDHRRRRATRRARAGDVVLTGLRNPWRFSFDRRARRGVDRRRRPGRRSRRSTACCSSSTSRPRTSAGARSRAPSASSGHDLDRGGELVWPVAEYAHPKGCSVTGGVVYGGAALPALGRRYVYGDFCSGAAVDARGTPGGGAPPTSGASRPTCRSSRTSAPTPTASCCSPPATARLYRAVPAGSGPDRRRARSPARRATRARGRPGARRGSRGGGCAGAGRSAARAAPAGRARRRSARARRPRPRRAPRRRRGRSRPTRAGSRPAPRPRARAPRRSGRARTHDAVLGGAGQHVGVAEELRHPARARALVDLLRRARPATTRPSRSTATVSASDSASAWSCVTSRALVPAARRIAATSSRSASRRPASSAANGSSSRTTSGSAASARASATRWRSPPESSCG